MYPGKRPPDKRVSLQLDGDVHNDCILRLCISIMRIVIQNMGGEGSLT